MRRAPDRSHCDAPGSIRSVGNRCQQSAPSPHVAKPRPQHHTITVITEALRTMVALDCLTASAPEGIESRSSRSSSSDMAVAAASKGGRRYRRGKRLQSPTALLSLLVWLALAIVVGAFSLPTTAAQVDDDEGAPFPISTTSPGIGRRYVRACKDGSRPLEKICRAWGGGLPVIPGNE